MSRSVEPVHFEEKRLTLSTQGMSLITFARWVSDRAGVSIIVDQGLDDDPVSLDVRDIPVSQLLASVARRLDSQVTRTGNVYYLGDLRTEDRGVLVRKVTRLDAEGAAAAIKTLVSEFGRVTVSPDGIVMVGDRVEVLERVAELLDRIEDTPLAGWVVQLHIVTLSESAIVDFGVDVTPTANLAAAVSMVSGGNNNVASLNLSAGLDGMLRAVASRGDVSAVQSPLILMIEGVQARIRDTQTIPVALRTVSPEGVVSTTDYEDIEIGFLVAAQLRELRGGGALLDLEVELSDLAGFVDDRPIRNRRLFASQVSVASGGVYLLASLDKGAASETSEGGFSAGSRRSGERGQFQIWARTYRIAEAGVEVERSGAERSSATAERDDAALMDDRWFVAAELAERDGRAGDQSYIRWLATGEWGGVIPEGCALGGDCASVCTHNGGRVPSAGAALVPSSVSE